MCVGRREHVHLFDDRVAESLAGECLDVGVRAEVEGESCLWNKFCSDDRVVVYAQSCIEGEPVRDVLSEVSIGCNLISMLTLDDVAFAVFGQLGLCACCLVCVPC